MSPLQILLIVLGALLFAVGLCGLGAAVVERLGLIGAFAAMAAGGGLIFYAVW